MSFPDRFESGLDLRAPVRCCFSAVSRPEGRRAEPSTLCSLLHLAPARSTQPQPSLPLTSLSSAHPETRPRGRVEGAAQDRCKVPRRGRAGLARARAAGGCGPSGLLLQVCAGGWTRRSCCARGGLLASASPGLLRPLEPAWDCSAGCEPATGAFCSRNRLYTLAAAAAGWLPPGRHSRFAFLPAGSYLPTGTL